MIEISSVEVQVHHTHEFLSNDPVQQYPSFVICRIRNRKLNEFVCIGILQFSPQYVLAKAQHRGTTKLPAEFQVIELKIKIMFPVKVNEPV